MDQPGVRTHAQPAPGGGPEFLVAEAIDIVLACLSRTEVPREEVVPLIEGVCGALAGATATAARLEPHLRRLGFEHREQAPASAEADVPSPAAPRVYTVEEALAEMSPGIERRARELFEPVGVMFREAREIPEASLTAVPPRVEATVEKAASTAAEPGSVAVPAREVPTRQAPVRVPPSRRKEAAKKVQQARPSARLARPPATRVPVPAEVPAAVPVLPKSARTKARSAIPAKPKEPKLPRGLKSVHDALRMDVIVCLDDGKKVKDLGAHLRAKGIDPKDYIARWGLPDEYPMMAPSAILKRGHTWEYDLVTDRFRPVRA